MTSKGKEGHGHSRESVGRWFAAGLLFMGVNTLALYLLVQHAHIRVFLATLLSAEICTLLRFLMNQHWVFRASTPSWRRLWQYHLANAGAFVVWWLGTNLLCAVGVNYLLASIAAVTLSTGFSFASNFYWVWRSHHIPPGGAPNSWRAE
jgi:putative flippase GtrA